MVPSGFGDPTCWVGELRFLPCCSTSAFGPGGNPDCWREDLGTSFQRCCLEPPLDGPEFERLFNETLERAQADFSASVVALAELIHRFDLERHALGSRPLRPQEVALLTELNDLVRQWRAGQLVELAEHLPGVLAQYNIAPPRAAPRIAILTACTPDSAGSAICRLGASLWQCYAQRHGYHFIFDTNPYPSQPQKFRFRSLRSRAQGQPLGALDAHFGDEDVRFLLQEPLALQIGSDATDFKWWQRWYAARRHLAAYDLLLVVDPDTAVFPSCTGVELPRALGLPEDHRTWPGVITRDPRDGEDLNGGVFALTSSPWGFLYIELLLARSRWPIDVAGGGGWCHARQSAEFETLLEVIALGHMLVSDAPMDYRSECMAHAVPQALPRAHGGQVVAGCAWPVYLSCWRKVMRRLIGPPGRRTAPHVRFVDPSLVDINYRPWSNEPRYRSPLLNATQVPPVANAAFLWHYVGIPGKVEHMLRDFGLTALEDTFDCQWLESFFGTAPEQLLPACGLAGSPLACPFGDSLLMPRAFGC